MSHNHDEDLDISILEQMGYEQRDLKIDKSGKAAGYFFFSILLTMAVAFGIMKVMQPNTAGRPDEMAGFRQMPPKDYPLLQSNVTAQGDTIDLLKHEDSHLNGYGWNSDSKADAHVPIDRAMDLVLEEGLPTSAKAKRYSELSK